MREPSRTNRALARPGAAKAYGCLTALSIYGAATNQVPWLVPVILGVLTVASRKATAEVGSYDRWTGAWKSHLRPEPRRSPARGRSALPNVRRRGALALLVFGGVWLASRAQESGVPVGTSIIGTFGLILGGLFVMRRTPGLRLLAGASPARRIAGFTVAIVPSVPMRAARPSFAGLPPYCRALLSNQAGASQRPATTSEFTH